MLTMSPTQKVPNIWTSHSWARTNRRKGATRNQSKKTFSRGVEWLSPMSTAEQRGIVPQDQGQRLGQLARHMPMHTGRRQLLATALAESACVSHAPSF